MHDQTDFEYFEKYDKLVAFCYIHHLPLKKKVKEGLRLLEEKEEKETEHNAWKVYTTMRGGEWDQECDKQEYQIECIQGDIEDVYDKLQEWKDQCEEHYVGKFESETKFAQYIYHNYDDQSDNYHSQYMDWDAYYNDVFHDYHEEDGYYFHAV